MLSSEARSYVLGYAKVACGLKHVTWAMDNADRETLARSFVSIAAECLDPVKPVYDDCDCGNCKLTKPVHETLLTIEGFAEAVALVRQCSEEAIAQHSRFEMPLVVSRTIRNAVQADYTARQGKVEGLTKMLEMLDPERFRREVKGKKRHRKPTDLAVWIESMLEAAGDTLKEELSKPKSLRELTDEQVADFDTMSGWVKANKQEAARYAAFCFDFAAECEQANPFEQAA